MMKMLKKITLIAMCLVMSLGSAAFLGGCNGNKADITVLLMVNNQQDAYFKEHFKKMSEELGISIDYQGYAFQDYDTQLKGAMQDNPPDIFYFRPGDIKKYVKDDILADFKSYLDSEDFKSEIDLSKIYEHAIDMYRYDGTNVSVKDKSASIYGINAGFSYQGLGYNRKLIERKATQITAAGLSLPWQLGTQGHKISYTFEEFTQVLSLVKDSSGGGLNGTSKIAGMNVPKDILPLAWAKGGEMLSGDNVTVNTPAFKFALDWLKTNYAAGNISKAATWGEWSVDEVAFFTEIGSWEVQGYIDTEFDFDMMPWPSEKGDDKWYGQIGTSAFGVYAHSENKDTAMKIATSFLREQVQDSMVKKGLALPMYVETAENGYLTDDETYKPSNRKVFIDVISGDNGKYPPINNTYNSEWYDKFADSVGDFVSGSASSESFLATKQSDMQALYNQSNKK